MSEHVHDPFGAPEPERFQEPQGQALPPSEPLLPAPDAAGTMAAPPDARLALDGTSVWLNRLGEELVAWLKTLASAAV